MLVYSLQARGYNTLIPRLNTASESPPIAHLQDAKLIHLLLQEQEDGRDYLVVTTIRARLNTIMHLHLRPTFKPSCW